MKAEEILRHPHFGRTTLQLEPRMKGKIDVAKDRNGPVHIAYEVHGNGPRHLIVCFICSRHTLAASFLFPFPLVPTRAINARRFIFDTRALLHISIFLSSAFCSSPKLKLQFSFQADQIKHAVHHGSWQFQDRMAATSTIFRP